MPRRQFRSIEFRERKEERGGAAGRGGGGGGDKVPLVRTGAGKTQIYPKDRSSTYQLQVNPELHAFDVDSMHLSHRSVSKPRSARHIAGHAWLAPRT